MPILPWTTNLGRSWALLQATELLNKMGIQAQPCLPGPHPVGEDRAVKQI